MKILPKNQILFKQLSLMQGQGHSLANFSKSLKSSNIFGPFSEESSNKINQFHPYNIKSVPVNANSNIEAFAAVMLQMIYEDNQKELLDQLKCILYTDGIDLTTIINKPKTLDNVSNNSMKRMMVEFFQLIKYASGAGKLYLKLNKHPIISDIFILTFRAIMKQVGIPETNNFKNKVNTKQVYHTLSNFFDLTMEEDNGVFRFPKHTLLISSYDQKQFVFSRYDLDGNSIPMQQEEEDEEEDNGNVAIPQHDLLKPYQKIYNLNLDSDRSATEDKEEQIVNAETETPQFYEPSTDDLNFRKRMKESTTSNRDLKPHNEIKELNEADETEKMDIIHPILESKEEITYLEEGINSTQGSPQIGNEIYKFQMKIEINTDRKTDRKIEMKRPSGQNDKPKLNMNLKKSKSERGEDTPRESIMECKLSQFTDIAGQTPKKEAKESHQTEHNYTNYSCSCTEIKVRKNQLKSNTMEVKLEPDFKKKVKTCGIETEKPHVPDFIKGRQQIRKGDKNQNTHLFRKFYTEETPQFKSSIRTHLRTQKQDTSFKAMTYQSNQPSSATKQQTQLNLNQQQGGMQFNYKHPTNLKQFSENPEFSWK